MATIDGVSVAGIGLLPAQRRPDPDVTTPGLLARAVDLALHDANLTTRDVDGFAVASFSLTPDRCIDLAWRLGLRLNWMMEDVLGLNAVVHAARAIQAGDASTIVVVGGDRLMGSDYGSMVDNFNRTTREYLSPIPAGGPNSLFALVTQDHMLAHGFDRETYGRVVISQRAWAGTNEYAAYRAPLTLDEYLAAPMVAPPLTRLDCPPIVAGAEAIVLTADRTPPGRRVVRLRATRSVLNHDGQAGDGLLTGLGEIVDDLWRDSGFGLDDIDVVSVYDDYPVMVLAQLEELGLAPDGDASRVLRGPGHGSPGVNTNGGLLTAGQAGGNSTTQGLVEAVRQLRHERGDGQVPDARLAVAVAYGMVLYRYGACSIAVTLEGSKR